MSRDQNVNRKEVKKKKRLTWHDGMCLSVLFRFLLTQPEMATKKKEEKREKWTKKEEGANTNHSGAITGHMWLCILLRLGSAMFSINE